MLMGNVIIQVLGRLASQISTVVQGKDKPTYAPNRDDGDICVILNAKHIAVTGRKLTDKFYRWHTGYLSFSLTLLFYIRQNVMLCKPVFRIIISEVM